jgi:hypothetical protein
MDKRSYQHKSTDEKVNMILELLQGSELDMKDDGLIGDVRNTKARLSKMEQWKDKTIAWAIGASFGAGAFISILIAIIVNYVTNKK